jgi:MSHA biogenesis protein MshE
MRVGSQKIRIGDLLMDRGIITEEQLQHALARQRESDKKLGRLLIEDNVLPEDKFLEFLSEQLDVPFVGLRQYRFDPELVIRLAESHARRHRTIVLSEANGTLLVGMADPLDIFSYDEISRLLKQNVDVALVRESELMDTLDTVYRRTSEIESYAVELESEVTEGLFDLEGLSVGLPGDEAPVVKMLQSIFEDAVQVRASDIHIEPDEGVLRIRQRVDGILQEQVMKEQRIGAPLVLRLKLMSGLNISEKRLPQDGRFSLLVREKRLDVRLSTMPIEYGESVVMRLLDQSTGITELDETGMSKVVLSQFRDLIHMPYGLILVTGPTGSGKTTTLYGALNELNQAGQKIITAEDPVEYKIARINQVQVNPLIGLDFANVLRASLRQDPDILLVGEIRDSETAEIALRAAMTGHLVLSTLHTNDAISSATRLMDMGVESFLAASSLRAILAQRLVRKLCDNCAKPHEATSDELSWLGRHLDEETIERANLMTTVGCPHCNESGFRGRIGVFELLMIKGAVADALRVGDAGLFIEEARQQPGYQPLIVSALELAVQGLTTVGEVLRVAQQVEQEAAFTNTGGLSSDDSQLALL